jgi:hypothetical protein
MAQAKTNLTGRWSIKSMSMWDADYINEEVPGYFDFGEKNLGSFHFGYVQGEVDYRLTERDGKPAVEFSWTGFEAGGGDECSGRGWMVLESDTLTGMFFFHCGDESEIVLGGEPKTKPKTPKTSRKRA